MKKYSSLELAVPVRGVSQPAGSKPHCSVIPPRTSDGAARLWYCAAHAPHLFYSAAAQAIRKRIAPYCLHGVMWQNAFPSRSVSDYGKASSKGEVCGLPYPREAYAELSQMRSKIDIALASHLHSSASGVGTLGVLL